MLHITLITIHACVAIVSFIFGLIVLRPPSKPGISPLYRIYIFALWLMILSLIAVVSVDWVHLNMASRSVFVTLTLFAIYIGWRGWQATHQYRTRHEAWKKKYIDDVGFTLIALFDGFAIIFVLDLGAPVWAAVATGVLAAFVGRFGLARFKNKVH